MPDKINLRELDAVIAEKVMQLKIVTVTRNNPAWFANKLVQEGQWVFLRHNEGYLQDVIDFPKYTTDPSASMAVLKKCALIIYKDGKHLKIRPDGDGFAVIANDGYDHEFASADTLELAICLFAKRLFAEKKEGV